MSDKTKSTSTSSLSSTRQLLDELDVLMERMLSLPVEDAKTDEDEKAEQPEQKSTSTSVVEMPRVDSESEPEGEVSEKPQVEEYESEPAEDSYEREEPEQHEEDNKTEPDTNYQYDESFDEEEIKPPEDFSTQVELETEESKQKDEPDLSSVQPIRTQEILVSLSAGRSDVLPEPLANRSQLLAQRRSWRRPWLWPLSALNRMFDSATYLLGPLGGWLRQPGGRTFLGLVGVTLVLAAICVQILLWLTWN